MMQTMRLASIKENLDFNSLLKTLYYSLNILLLFKRKYSVTRSIALCFSHSISENAVALISPISVTSL